MAKSRFNYENIDVVGLLKSMGIELSFAGKNVTKGWVNTQCPFCADDSTHLGINLKSKNVSCWICRESGTLWKYLKKKTNKDNKEIYRLLKPYIGTQVYQHYEESRYNKKSEVILPTHCYEKALKIHELYLEERGFNHKFLEKIYDIKYTGQISKYRTTERLIDFRYRIIIPIYIDGVLVNFTARDVTDKAEEKYKNCPTDDALMTTKDCIYGYDTIVGDSAVLVEGPTDVWNLGPGTGGLFGLKYTENQIKLLYKRKLKRVVLFFDNEEKAQTIAKKLAFELGSFIPEVLILEPDDEIDDPGSMTKEQVRKLWNMVNRRF